MKKFGIIFAIALNLIGLSSCQRNIFESDTVAPTTLRDVPALRLNFRFENDVPAPPDKNANAQSEEKNEAIQADFNQNRPQEMLEKTILSPDKKRFLVVYRKDGDLDETFRLDMFTAEGKLLNKITPNGLAVYYPDTILWSPDSNSVAFVGKTRPEQTAPTPQPNAPPPPSLENTNSTVEANSNVETNSNPNTESNANLSTPIEPGKQVLTFRTEQIYTCQAEGKDLKPITQNEGLVYFYFVWSPDSSALATLATSWREWNWWYWDAKQKGEAYIPKGRPRVVEKTGRIRLLDDNVTPTRPVWSPDSAKIALAFDKEVRIYDAIGNTPTQAAIPLRNQMLLAAKKYDEEIIRQEAANSNTNTNTNANVPNNSTPSDVNVLPDEKLLLSFNPIIQLDWSEDKILYLQTGFILEFTGEKAAYSARNKLRWHRLLLSPQPVK